VRFIKKYPHTLAIVPVLRPATARLRSNDRLVLVDADGVVLVDGDQGMMLPTLLFTIPALHVGKKISDTRIQLALAVLKGLYGSLVVESITEQDGAYMTVKSGKTDIFIPQTENAASILATLQTLMTGFRIKGTLPAVVDLRFDKPVVKF
jgi:hypothetical protein